MQELGLGSERLPMVNLDFPPPGDQVYLVTGTLKWLFGPPLRVILDLELGRIGLWPQPEAAKDARP